MTTTNRTKGAARHGPKRFVGAALLLVASALMLAGCAAGANDVAGTGPDQAGFLLGLWHGFISPITFIVSLFVDDVGIYEIRNNGGWYDFGFMIGVSAVFSGAGGSGGAAARRGRPRGA